MRTFISLGHHCGAAYFLRKHGWLKAPSSGLNDLYTRDLSAVCDLLETGFRDFFSLENIMIREDWTGPKYHWVIDQKYQVAAPHFFPVEEPVEEWIEIFLSKKRLNVFVEWIRTADNPVVIRSNTPEESLSCSVRLYDVLKTMRQDAPFELIIFQENELMQHNWGIPQLETYYCRTWKWRPGPSPWDADEDFWWQVLAPKLKLDKPLVTARHFPIRYL